MGRAWSEWGSEVGRGQGVGDMEEGRQVGESMGCGREGVN